MLVLLSLYVMLTILLSILVCAAESLFCACLVSVQVSAPYVMAGSTQELLYNVQSWYDKVVSAESTQSRGEVSKGNLYFNCQNYFTPFQIFLCFSISAFMLSFHMISTCQNYAY